MTAPGYSIWHRLLGEYPVNKVAPFLLLLPIVVTAESIIFLGERLTWMISIGGAATLSGDRNSAIEVKIPPGS